jgi:hypothetical protein
MKNKLWRLVIFLALLLNSFGVWNYLSFGVGLGLAKFYLILNVVILLFLICCSFISIQDEINSNR